MEPLDDYKNPIEKELFDLPDLEAAPSKPFTKICCPSCNSEIAAANLNINDKIGKCDGCNAVFPFTQELQLFNTTTQKVKQEILRPEGIEMFYYKDELDISFNQPDSWAEWLFYLIIPFIVVPPSMGMAESGAGAAAMILPALAFFIAMVYFFRSKKHKVFVTIDKQYLNIAWRPTKLIKDKKYAVRDINQLYVKKRKDTSSWNVWMIVDKGKGQEHVKLTSLKSISKAKFLEQEIERQLGIQDVVVPEED